MSMGEKLMNNNTVNESVEEVHKKRVRSRKRFPNWKFIALGVGIIALRWGSELLSGNSLQFECYD